MGDSRLARCLQGGGVFVDAGSTVSIVNSQVYSNRAGYVRALQNFPSPRRDFHMFRASCLQGGGVVVAGGTMAISSCTISGNTAQYVRANVLKFPSP